MTALPTPRLPDGVVSGRVMRLSIRARLTLWYSVVVFVVLVAAGAAVLWLQAGLGLTRVDQTLAAATDTVAGVLRNELDEGLPFEQAAHDMMAELDLAAVGFAVLTDGRVVAAKPAGRLQPPGDRLVEAPDAATVDVDAAERVRMRTARLSHRGHRFAIVVWTSMAPLQEERETLQFAMLLGIPLALLLAGLGGLGIGRRSLQPLADMAAQAEATGVQTADTRLIAPNPDDELGTLARAFNGLLERLARSLRAQRTFMAEASHQLRTPVSIVRTTAQVTLGREGRTEAEYREALALVATQAGRLTRMVDDMFMLALADAESRPLQPVPVYLDELVDGVVDEARLLAATRRVELRSESSGETPFVGDPHLLRQLLLNLLDNALRLTPAGGSVIVSLRRDATAVTVAVSDTGPGVARGREADIFERFVRLDAAGGEGGAGLGLPIARWIAEAHGGTLILESTTPSGSRFLVTLPIASSQTPGRPTATAVEQRPGAAPSMSVSPASD